MMRMVGRFPIKDGARLAPFMEGGHFSVRDFLCYSGLWDSR